MRSTIFTILSLFTLTFAWQAQAESRYCAGSCDGYGNPVYNVPVDALPDGHGGWVSPNPPAVDPLPTLRNDYLLPAGYTHTRRYRREVRHRRVRRHHRQYRQKRRYRKHRHHRRYRRSHRRYHEHRGHRRYARPTFHNRTKYCRDEVEWKTRRHGIRHCIWVRNDLIYRYEGRGYHRH